MKIGILTFHSQLNYGGVLQCWALQTALEKMGHEVVVIDRWRDKVNKRLRGPFANCTLRAWLSILRRFLSGRIETYKVMRHWRTMRFVKRKLNLTKYHFCQWKEICDKMDIDCVVVGSDQVWHGGDWGDPAPYLMVGAPNIPRIAYAVSIGMHEFPDGLLPMYLEGFKHFKAISMRENESVKLMESVGVKSVHVCDPVVLLDRELWHPLRKKDAGNRMILYFLKEPVVDKLVLLDEWAKREGWIVDIFVGETDEAYRAFQSVRESPVLKFHGTFGPDEFISTFRNAAACVSDSFHAMVFSSIFDVNCRILSPSSIALEGMFARIKEFVVEFSDQKVIVPSFHDALHGIAKGEVVRFNQDKINLFRMESRKWLYEVMKGMGK